VSTWSSLTVQWGMSNFKCILSASQILHNYLISHQLILRIKSLNAFERVEIRDRSRKSQLSRLRSKHLLKWRANKYWLAKSNPHHHHNRSDKNNNFTVLKDRLSQTLILKMSNSIRNNCYHFYQCYFFGYFYMLCYNYVAHVYIEK